MARYQIDTEDSVEYVEADSINRDEGYLILLRDGQVVAVFLRWNFVLLMDSDD